MDAVAISAIVISILTATGALIQQIHLKRCGCFCINSDCSKTPEPSLNETTI